MEMNGFLDWRHSVIILQTVVCSSIFNLVDFHSFEIKKNCFIFILFGFDIFQHEAFLVK